MEKLAIIFAFIAIGYCQLPLDNQIGSINDQTNRPLTDSDYETLFHRTNVPRLKAALSALRQRWSSKLQQMPSRISNNGANSVQQPMYMLRPKSRDRIRSEGDTLPQVNRAAGLNDLLYQGDMILTENQISTILEDNGREKRQAYRDQFYPSTTWGSTVYYYYDQTATPKIRQAFEEAVNYWQTHTCINIVQSSTALHRIRVFKGQGCYSYVGRITGVQDLSLGTGCEEFGTAAHELGHALGFFHTQSRYDRDNYITINYTNIEPSFMDQFDKESPTTNYNYGMPYDYGSIMQYGSTSASRNDQPTMIAKDYEYQDTMGSDFVGFYDVSMMNEHYKCKELCPALTSAKCENGGYPHPRDCQQCICPSGYGGPLCDRRPDGCGGVLTATNEYQQITESVGDGIPKLRGQHDLCHYWIEAPENQAIEIRINSLKSITIDGCIFGGIEIKAHKDQKLTGYRYCSSADQNTVHTSQNNRVPVILYNRYGSTTANVDYRFVSPSEAITPTTPVPIVNSCQDAHPNCPLLRFFGMCVYKKTKKMCRFTCKMCTNGNSFNSRSRFNPYWKP